MTHRQLAERYARGLKKRWVFKAVPWPLLVSLALLLLRWYLQDVRAGRVTITDLFGPPALRLESGPYTADLDPEDVATWMALED